MFIKMVFVILKLNLQNEKKKKKKITDDINRFVFGIILTANSQSNGLNPWAFFMRHVRAIIHIHTKINLFILSNNYGKRAQPSRFMQQA